MSEIRSTSRGVLYVISCASRPAQRVQDFVRVAQAAGWEVCVVVTPQATKFVDSPLLEELTGYPVRCEYKRPEELDVLPRADALVVFPATFNTLNKWALGISDTLALGLLCEYTGLKMPIVAVPCVLTVIPRFLEVLPNSESTVFMSSTSRRNIRQRMKFPGK
jgi:hypothetical protein